MHIKYPEDDYIVFDLETTGFNPETDRVIEVAAMWISGGEPRNTFDFLIKIDQPIPAEITGLTGISQQMIDREGAIESEVWPAFIDFIGDKPIIGHNVLAFDNKFLIATFKRLGLSENGLNAIKWVDTAAIYKSKKLDQVPYWYENHIDFARRILNIRAIGVKFNLALCCEELNIDCSSYVAHRALGDCFMVAEIYKKFLEESND